MNDRIEVYVNGLKTDDIAALLRKCVVMTEGMAAIRNEAADEIERLRARLAEAERLLRRSCDALIDADRGLDAAGCVRAIDAFLARSTP